MYLYRLTGAGLSDAPEGVEYTMGLMADAIYEVVNERRSEEIRWSRI